MTPGVGWRQAQFRHCLLGCGSLLVSLLSTAAGANQQIDTAPTLNKNRAVSASAQLDFAINIGKFLFFRVGTNTSGTVDTVAFTSAPSIPAGGVNPSTGNSTSVNWSGVAPTFNVTASNNILPVEVRSNAGQISIRATATTPLTSGTNTIPLSEIVVTSNAPDLPAPLIPNSGQGAAVNVTGTNFTNLVTVRSANWTFAYNALTSPVAGLYSGQITFTATSP